MDLQAFVTEDYITFIALLWIDNNMFADNAFKRFKMITALTYFFIIKPKHWFLDILEQSLKFIILDLGI